MRYAIVREGKALLQIPDPSTARAPHGFEPSWLPVFYNPRMIFNRDLSVIALHVYTEHYAPHKPVHGVDALSGTGVRAVRYAIESGSDILMHANDIDPNACNLISSNITLNKLEDRITPHCTDANILLIKLHREEPILFTDIDPFGSPAPYTTQAIRTTGHRGMIGFTATDLAVLEGSKTHAAKRKYLVDLKKTPESKEVGLRVLLGFIARMAAFNDKEIRPLLSYYADHYYRVYVQVMRGARRADRMLQENLGYAYYCSKSKRTLLGTGECPKDEKPIVLGPLWISSTVDIEFISLINNTLHDYKYLETHTRIAKLVDTIEQESRICGRCLFYRLDSVASANVPRLPKIRVIMDRLQDMGYRVARSHFHPMGIRTDAPYKAVVEAMKS